MGVEHGVARRVAFEQISDNYIMRSSSDSMGKPRSVVRGGSPGQGYVTYSSVDRCITTWMGSSVPRELCKRGVVSDAETEAHKLFGITSCLSSSGTFCPAFAGQTCVSQDRQHDGGVIYKQARGHSLSAAVTTRSEAPDMEQRIFSITQGSACSGLSEWRGRHAVQRRPTGQGVALAPADSGADLGSLWQSDLYGSLKWIFMRRQRTHTAHCFFKSQTGSPRWG